MRVPFIDLKEQYKNIKHEIDSAIAPVIENGTFILGKPVEEFETTMTSYLQVASLGCASGSDALLLALMASNVGKDDEVITTPFTFFATAGAVARLGAKPVFVDIDPDTFNIDPAKIEAAVTTKTKAIIPVHIFGQPADMDTIMKIANSNSIKVIEDACQAVGADYKGTKVGGIGDFGCFSFFPTKNLGGFGDGGLISCKNDEDFKRVKKLRVHGSEKKYFHDEIGINSRLDALQAVVLSVKLKYLEKWNNKRIEIARRYSSELGNVVKTPKVLDNVKHIYHQYAIITGRRDELMKFLSEKEISSGVYYPLPLHLQKCFADLGYKEGDMPNSEYAALNILSLPIYPEMRDEQIEYVISSVKEFFSL